MKRSGFTLLELIVASTVFAIVMAAAYALLRSGHDMVEKGEGHADVFQTARAVLRDLERDLKAVWASGSSYDTGLVGQDDGDETIPLDEIEFLAVRNKKPLPTEDEEQLTEEEKEEVKESPMIDLSRVSYYIDEEEGLMCRRIRLLKKSVVGVDDEEEAEQVCADVVGLNLRYSEDGSWKEVWDSTRSRKLPQAIEVTIVMRPPGREEWEEEELDRFTTRVYVHLWENVPEQEEDATGTGQ
ncbi:MAG: prepilin-type N-terminal cleavage/methylation domain-containing protein [Planctomycetota bacterium]|jgi:prepilin-type N-terminal cleavage/methylation domain-containing protein